MQMSEKPSQYHPSQPNPAGIPTRWLRFLYHMAKLQDLHGHLDHL